MFKMFYLLFSANTNKTSPPSAGVSSPSRIASNADAVNEIKGEISRLQGDAIKYYNQQDYITAEEAFKEVLNTQHLLFPENHPDIIKTEKSILLVQRKKAAAAASSR